MPHSQYDTFPCPFCGADVREGAKVCRSCGATDDCGWNEDNSDDGSDDDFDYNDFVAREFPDHPQTASPAAAAPLWMRLVILAILISFLLTLGLL